jgi:DNA polymerase
MSRKNELSRIKNQIFTCKKCRLSKTRQHAVPGEGPLNAKIMLIGQGPGREEDKQGRPFAGKAGKFLNELLQKNGIDRKEVFITSCVKCYLPKNRAPKKDELEACRPYVLRQIQLINPEIVVLMGNVAHGLAEHTGKRVMLKTPHPAAGMRFPKQRIKIFREFGKITRFIKQK